MCVSVYLCVRVSVLMCVCTVGRFADGSGGSRRALVSSSEKSITAVELGPSIDTNASAMSDSVIVGDV